MKKIFLSLVIMLTLVLLGTGTYIYSVFKKSYNGPDTTFVVHNGDHFGKINQRLYSEGLIPDKRFFHYYAKYKDYLTKFRAGSFTIPTGSNMGQVLETLVHGRPNLTSITIPEGKNLYEIAKMFAAAGITTEEAFLQAVIQPDLISQFNIQATNLEGYLFPETYRFAPNTQAGNVVKTMVELFNTKTKDINFEHPFLSKHQIITLASVVEKETGAKWERPMIAGVFLNRLKKRMRLQSDPTTIYGIWHRYQGNIRRSDLLEFTPYNTYKIPALPQGPIANPSLEAIQAVLNPQDHDFLYFVSKNDGTHIFTKTYKDHNKAVDDFQRNSKARQGKSWRDLKKEKAL